MKDQHRKSCLLTTTCTMAHTPTYIHTHNNKLNKYKNNIKIITTKIQAWKGSSLEGIT